MHTVEESTVMVDQSTVDTCLMSYSDIERITTINRRTIQRLVNQGKFPAPLALPGAADKGRRVAFRASDVYAWLEVLQPAKSVGGSNE
jgi:predicted DNA-binding transcriptional regulator AlpA